MRYYIYGNGGGIDEVRKGLEDPKDTFNSIKDVFLSLSNRACNMYGISDLSVKYFCYDDRIDKDVYMVVTNRCGKENYLKKHGCPQFVSYLVEID